MAPKAAPDEQTTDISRAFDVWISLPQTRPTNEHNMSKFDLSLDMLDIGEVAVIEDRFASETEHVRKLRLQMRSPISMSLTVEVRTLHSLKGDVTGMHRAEDLI